jgi:hypothetical protein
MELRKMVRWMGSSLVKLREGFISSNMPMEHDLVKDLNMKLILSFLTTIWVKDKFSQE